MAWEGKNLRRLPDSVIMVSTKSGFGQSSRIVRPSLWTVALCAEQFQRARRKDRLLIWETEKYREEKNGESVLRKNSWMPCEFRKHTFLKQW